MSHDATNWAIRQKGLKPGAKIVLWHLCDRFHPDNGCFPSLDTLAADCELSRRSVQNHIEELEAAGLVRVEKMPREHGRLPRNSYRFAFEGLWQNLPEANPALGKSEPPPLANSDVHLGQDLPTNLVKGTSKRTSNAPAFDEFWAKWPNKVAKGAALTAWKKLKADEKRRVVEVCASWFAAWRKANPELSPIHPATFLNKRRWEDEGVSQPTAPTVDIRQALADRIKSGKQWLVRDISPAQARELIAAGLVTQEDCRKAGVA
jgi:DNA-binding MarR family transcriptional regulator